MKIYALMENTPYSAGFASEHGLSLYIETKKHRILFDAGQSDAFYENAKRLGVDLETVDIAVLSHGHYDHSGGMELFLKLNRQANVFVTGQACGDYYHGRERYIGIAPSLKESKRLTKVDDTFRIDDELTLCTCNGQKLIEPIDTAGLTCKNGEAFVPDSFCHEQYLVIREEGKKVVISGCSHKGIVNITDWLRPDVLVGGFHLKGQKVAQDSNPRLDETAEKLLQYGCTYFTCHCTGKAQYGYMKKKMGDRLHYLAAGQMVAIGT